MASGAADPQEQIEDNRDGRHVSGPMGSAARLGVAFRPVIGASCSG